MTACLKHAPLDGKHGCMHAYTMQGAECSPCQGCKRAELNRKALLAMHKRIVCYMRGVLTCCAQCEAQGDDAEQHAKSQANHTATDGELLAPVGQFAHLVAATGNRQLGSMLAEGNSLSPCWSKHVSGARRNLQRP